MSLGGGQILDEDLALRISTKSCAAGEGRTSPMTKKEWPLWEIFIRGQHGMAHRHVGSLHAPDAEMAVKHARDVYTRRNEGVSIWVVEARHITASSPSDKGPLYEPSGIKGLPPPHLLRHPRRRGGHVMEKDAALFEYLCRLGDNTLILGHRVSEWCGHAPMLEEDIALANTALDLIGQTQLWLGLAGEVEGNGRSADDLAYPARRLGFPEPADRRTPEPRFRPHHDAPVPVRRLGAADAGAAHRSSGHERIADIAAKAVKETAYHLERSTDIVIGLGDGTPESHAGCRTRSTGSGPTRARCSSATRWMPRWSRRGIAPDPESLRAAWRETVDRVLAEATLAVPDSDAVQKGGKQGRHTEHLGHILSTDAMAAARLPGGHVVSQRRARHGRGLGLARPGRCPTRSEIPAISRCLGVDDVPASIRRRSRHLGSATRIAWWSPSRPPIPAAPRPA
jgi:ring-1,2-phenylacetyl-CoA epoxidase subunit PaaC